MRILLPFIILLCHFIAILADDKKPDITNFEIKATTFSSEVEYEISFLIKNATKNFIVPISCSENILLLNETYTQKKYTVELNETEHIYQIRILKSGAINCQIRFLGRIEINPESYKRMIGFKVFPKVQKNFKIFYEGNKRNFSIIDAIQVNNVIEDQKGLVTGVLANNSNLEVTWEPTETNFENHLVSGVNVTSLMKVSSNSLQISYTYQIDVLQGSFKDLLFYCPSNLHITAVEGLNIQDWKMSQDQKSNFHIQLNQAQKKKYLVQISGEVPIETLPTDLTVPNLILQGDFRVFGTLTIAPQNTLQTLVKKSSGLTQIDTPETYKSMQKAFCYSHAGAIFDLILTIKEIKPSFDVKHFVTFMIREDHLQMNSKIQLDIREAPIKKVVLLYPSIYQLSDIKGAALKVKDFVSSATSDIPDYSKLEIPLQKPIMGSFMFDVEFATKRDINLHEYRSGAIMIEGSNSERGTVAIGAVEGFILEQPSVIELKDMQTGALEIHIAEAKYAYRFRKNNWSVHLFGSIKQTGIFAESLHLLSIANRVVYGSSVISYRIAGSPVDTLSFVMPSEYQNIEFIGKDVVNWDKDKSNTYKVKLRRKVIGDYNLGISYMQKLGDDNQINLCGIKCCETESQNGFVVIASQENILIGSDQPTGLFEISSDELPKSYQLMVHSPVLKVYKFISPNYGGKAKLDLFKKANLVDSLIEVMSLESKIFLRENGSAEGVTAVRYIIKNSNEQYLDLVLPSGAVVWSTKYINNINDNSFGATRITASRDGDILKIPLQHKSNPNEPIMIELQYGQSLGVIGSVFDLHLTAPKSEKIATYSEWRLILPEQWVARPLQKNGNLSVIGKWTEPSINLFINKVLDNTLKMFRNNFSINFIFSILFCICGVGLLGKYLFKFKWQLILLSSILMSWLTIGFYIFYMTFRSGEALVNQNSNIIIFANVLLLSNSLGAEISAQVASSSFYLADKTEILAIAIILGLSITFAYKWSIFRLSAYASLVLFALSVSLHWHATHIYWYSVFTWLAPLLFLVGLLFRHFQLNFGSRRAIFVSALVFLFSGILFSKSYAEESILIPNKEKAQEVKFKNKNQAEIINLDRKLKYEIEILKDHYHYVVDLEIKATKNLTIPFETANIYLEATNKLPKYVLIEKNENNTILKFQQAGFYKLKFSYLKYHQIIDITQLDLQFMPLPALFCSVKLIFPQNDLEIYSESAFQIKKEVLDEKLIFSANFSANQLVDIRCRPKTRDVKNESVEYFVKTSALWGMGKGVGQAEYLFQYKIVQGELAETELHLPENIELTHVNGDFLGSWSFKKEQRLLKIHFLKPISNSYVLNLGMQFTQESMPYEWGHFYASVNQALRNTLELGFYCREDVTLQITSDQMSLDVNEFKNTFSQIYTNNKTIGRTFNQEIKHAYRMLHENSKIIAKVTEILPELRLEERSSFSVEEEKQILNSNMILDIDKSGVFYVSFVVPQHYDIESISSNFVSHYDELEINTQRIIQVHFLRKIIGPVPINITLNRNHLLGSDDIEVPHISLLDNKKHDGIMIVSCGRGMQLRVKKINSAIEKDPNLYQVFDKKALAFKILTSDFSISLKPEIMTPRINLEFLNEIRISEGVAHYTAYLRYLPFNAGVKEFKLLLPDNVFGVRFSGAQIANKRQDTKNPALWLITLEDKWYDGEYPLTVYYESKFENQILTPQLIQIDDVDLVNGYIAVYSNERIELSEKKGGNELQKFDARNIPVKFGAGDLYAAAYCYAINSLKYDLQISVKRHQMADLLSAEVVSSHFQTIMNKNGDSMTRVQLQLTSGGKRNLEVSLPENSEIWSVVVNGKFEYPCLKGQKNDLTYLIALPDVSFSEKSVEFEMTYVLKNSSGLERKVVYKGPGFDLPLKNMVYEFYVPNDWQIDQTDGTMIIQNKNVPLKAFNYSIEQYKHSVSELIESSGFKCRAYQKQAEQFSRLGQRKDALNAYKNSYNWSMFDSAMNEDARVQLHQMNQDQSIVGLIDRRQEIVRNMDGKVPSYEVGKNLDQLNESDIASIQNSVGQADQENIKMICQSFVRTQETVSIQNNHLFVALPLDGQKIDFSRSIQVKPFDDLTIGFEKRVVQVTNNTANILSLLTLVTLTTFCFFLVSKAFIVQKQA